MNGPVPDLLQVFSLKLMNLEEKGTETWMELLGTHVAYFWVDFNLTYESNLDHHSVTHLSLRCSVTGPKFLVVQSKLHLLFLKKKNAKGPPGRVKHRKTWSRGRVKKCMNREHSVELQGEFACGYTIYHSICRLNKAIMWYQMILDEQQRGQGINKMDFIKIGVLASF